MTMERFESLVWEMLLQFTTQERVQFIAYVTGSPVLDLPLYVKLCDAPSHAGDGPFARQCAQYVSIPSYPEMTVDLLLEVMRTSMAASMQFGYDTI